MIYMALGPQSNSWFMVWFQDNAFKPGLFLPPKLTWIHKAFKWLKYSKEVSEACFQIDYVRILDFWLSLHDLLWDAISRLADECITSSRQVPLSYLLHPVPSWLIFYSRDLRCCVHISWEPIRSADCLDPLSQILGVWLTLDTRVGNQHFNRF